MLKVVPMGPREWALLLTLSVLWGGSFLFAHVAVAEMSPLTVVFGRVAVAGACLLAVGRLRGLVVPRRLRDVRDFAVMGMFNNVVPFTLLFWALQHIEAGLAAILNATTPFFTVLLAQVLTDDEKINPGKVAGVVLGISGVSLLIGVQALDGVGDDLLPSFACLGAAVSYATSSIWARRFRGQPPLATATGQLVSSSLILLPIVVWVDRPWQGDMPGAAALASLVALAVVSTAVAYILYFRILQTAGATNVALVTLLVPASAALLGWLVLGEALTPAAFLGMALIALGIAAMDGRPLARLRRPTRRPAV